MNEWADWLGREQHRADWLGPALVERWCATLDRASPAGGLAPQGMHWALCTPDEPTAALGPDGHPRRDDTPQSFLPPLPLPRRMWAASKVSFLAPLRAGHRVERLSRVASVTAKQGGSGQLVFVEVEHETLCGGEAAVREVQSLVYREASPPGAALAPPPPGPDRFDPAPWDAVRTLEPGEPLLFRFSALTFNSHRIHYDLPYATGEEGYRGLVVHGPLTATLLLDLARRELGEQALAAFSFRGLSPAICGEQLHLALRRAGATLELGAFASDGRAVMSASATTA